MMKRIFDISLLLILLPACLLLLLIVALCALVFMGRPILFSQERIGLNGKIFKLIKFRTMNCAVNHNHELLPDKDRLTCFGKFLRKSSLDELPQLMNVLKGEMSIVGPRPLLPEYLDRYTTQHARRHEVKPGITGWAQVNGRNAVDWEDRFEMDRWYVDNHNLWLDIKILLLTVVYVGSGAGITARGSATMPKYEGGRE